jgi:FKBP-type peptidyl-prolyl cis-trans isomerase (trigger factor)
MKVDIAELSPIQRKVSIELPADRVAKEFSHAYKNLGQRVTVKGFRTGKIPRGVLQGIYGEDIKGEVRSHLVEECLAEVQITTRGLGLRTAYQRLWRNLATAAFSSYSSNCRLGSL